jgi:hypothetical protein
MVLRTAVFHRGCGRQGRHLLCKQSHAGALPAISTIVPWELPRLADCKSAVKKLVGRRPVEHYHQLPPFLTPTPWVPKPKSSRRTVVNRVTNECESRRDRACGGQYFSNSKKLPCAAPSGTRKIANPRRLGRRDTRSVTGVPDHFPSL